MTSGQEESVALLTRSTISLSTVSVISVMAKDVGHMLPRSSFALSLKPSVAYLLLNFPAFWKKQTTLPSQFEYAGIPYQSLGERYDACVLINS